MSFIPNSKCKLLILRRGVAILVIFLFLLQECLPYAIASELSVFKKTYVRYTGKPAAETDSFSVLNSNKPYTLKVVNGLPDASARVSSASGYLNSSQILKADQFNQNVGSIGLEMPRKTEQPILVHMYFSPLGLYILELE